ncbi:MAG: hypothetical protein R3F30_13330 [Planctomycetota bacterium]
MIPLAADELQRNSFELAVDVLPAGVDPERGPSCSCSRPSPSTRSCAGSCCA